MCFLFSFTSFMPLKLPYICSCSFALLHGGKILIASTQTKELIPLMYRVRNKAFTLGRELDTCNDVMQIKCQFGECVAHTVSAEGTTDESS